MPSGLPALTGTGIGGLSLALSPDSMSLLLTGGFPPTDLNQNGMVDSLDLGILLGNFGQVTTPDMGELNGTPPVDSLDLGLLLADFGMAFPLSASAVPEPTSALLLCAGMSLLVTMKRSRFVR